jgi:hypothetical protein
MLKNNSFERFLIKTYEDQKEMKWLLLIVEIKELSTQYPHLAEMKKK